MKTVVVGLSLAAVTAAPPARAGDFDGYGNYLPDPEAVALLDFGADFDPEAGRYLPADAPMECTLPAFLVVAAPTALDGDQFVTVNSNIALGCAERFLVDLPAVRASYRATMWMRHGSVDAQMTMVYPPESGLELTVAKMGPTGRVTSDGWVELATNPFPVDGTKVTAVYLRIYDYDDLGSDIDAVEVVPVGDYTEEATCTGLGDPACSDQQVCVSQKCRTGDLYVPPMPDARVRDDVIDVMQSQARVFFGGRKTRLSDLPAALAQLDAIRKARTGWEFWNGWATAIRLLHDWHTRASGAIGGIDRTKRLNVCFIEGDADTSALSWPKDPRFPDVLVSHVGGDATYGIDQGDRLVAVDGMHPVEWALGLVDTDWGYWQACDDATWAEGMERLRGNITRYAQTFDIIHCDASTNTCDAAPEHYVVTDLPDSDGSNVGCDNRPVYHYGPGQNPENHRVNFDFFSGRVVDATEAEAVYGLLWDTLSGDGNPTGHVNGSLTSAFTQFKQNARGVILDHRAGSGGTLDGAETATHLVRPPETVLVFSSPIEMGGWNGPETALEGVAFFDALKNISPMVAGSTSYDPDMPVALCTHRDGSASDFFPFAMKGASDKVRLFGPGPTAGAFSTFYEMEYWGGISYALASGDSVAADGSSLIGHGVVPDVIVQQKQSDLLDGRDTIHDAALAWVLTELKP